MKGDEVVERFKIQANFLLFFNFGNINYHILELIMSENFLSCSLSSHRQLFLNAVV